MMQQRLKAKLMGGEGGVRQCLGQAGGEQCEQHFIENEAEDRALYGRSMGKEAEGQWAGPVQSWERQYRSGQEQR